MSAVYGAVGRALWVDLSLCTGSELVYHECNNALFLCSAIIFLLHSLSSLFCCYCDDIVVHRSVDCIPAMFLLASS